jgi:hypothetical protein
VQRVQAAVGSFDGKRPSHDGDRVSSTGKPPSKAGSRPASKAGSQSEPPAPMPVQPSSGHKKQTNKLQIDIGNKWEADKPWEN